MAEEATTTPETPKKKVGGAAPKRVKVRIHNQEGVVGGTADVFVGVNGRGYQIKREEDVELPVEVLHALDNAVMTVVERGDDGNEIQREIKRFAYSKV